MKNLLLSLVMISMTACGAKGGGANGADAAVPVDSAPHTYTAGFFNADGTSQALTIRQECNVGFAGTRDETVSLSENQSGYGGAIGCADSRNYRATFTNLGAATLLVFTIDGVYRPELDRVLAPAEVYTFERGY